MSSIGRKIKPHRHHEHLTGEHRFGDAGQVILVLLFLAVWAADSFFLHYTTFLNDRVPFSVRIAAGAMILFSAGFMSRKAMSIVFREDHNPPGVIREGIFNIVRHPVYLSELLLYFGVLVFSLSLAAAAVWIAAIAFLFFISRFEEKLLLERFGEEYRKYMAEVPMWFPRLLKK